jgi:hypothetical protein
VARFDYGDSMRLALIGLLLTGCYIVEPGPGPSGDDTPPPPGGEGPVGRSFFIERIPTSPSCADFAEENQTHQISVQTNQVFVGGALASGTTVRSAPANESSDAPNVIFVHDEFWTSTEGSTAVQIHYTIWVSGPIVTGDVLASFQFLGSFCSYMWRVQT